MGYREDEELIWHSGSKGDKQPNEHCNPMLRSVVSIPEDAFQNRLGKYFIGQTGFLSFDNECYAGGGLINPANSGVNLFIGVFTISNFTAMPFEGQVWFNTELPGDARVSRKVSPGNTALHPLPAPRVKLEYASCMEGKPRGGVNPFLRIVEPYSTLVAEQQGRQIIPPGGDYIITLRSIEPCQRRQVAKIVFAWWEERIKY